MGWPHLSTGPWVLYLELLHSTWGRGDWLTQGRALRTYVLLHVAKMLTGRVHASHSRLLHE
jgi:hypothetical protein